MKRLEALSVEALHTLALATNLPGPPQKWCPKFWQYLGDCVAAEMARRNRIECPEPPVPELSDAELEYGALVLAGMADASCKDLENAPADPAAADVLHGLAEDVVRIRASGLLHREDERGN